nr:hypothetical protein [Candidatus Gracilibacteria bacterium]
FISTAKPIGSNELKKNEQMEVSAATIRNEMAELEKEGLLTHPHTSAGRIPTVEGYRYFVDNLLEVSEEEKSDMFEEFKTAQKRYFLAKVKEKVSDGIAILSQLTENVAFATLPENQETIFLGIANLLRQPEFMNNTNALTGVIEVLEQGFMEHLEKIEIGEQVSIHIGENNLFPNIQSCSLMCVHYQHLGLTGTLGILGPIRMNYPRNKVLLEYAKLFIEGQKLLMSA